MRGRRFYFAPGRCRSCRGIQKGVADEATQDADDAHDDPERSDAMTKNGDGDRAMLSIAETSALMQTGWHELGTLLFGRKKQREKKRR